VSGFGAFGEQFSQHAGVVLTILLVAAVSLAGSLFWYAKRRRTFWKNLQNEEAYLRGLQIAGVDRIRVLGFFRLLGALTSTVVLAKVITQDYLDCAEAGPWKDAESDGQGFFYCSIDAWLNHIFKFFTCWNWVLITAAFLVGTCRSLAPHSAAIAKIHHGMLAACIPLAPAVTLLTWGLLYPAALGKGEGDTYTHLDSYFMHIGNTVLCLGEFWLSLPKFDQEHFIFVVCFSEGFAVNSVLLQLGAGKAPYFFFDIRKPFITVPFVFVLWIFAFSMARLFSHVSFLQARYFALPAVSTEACLTGNGWPEPGLSPRARFSPGTPASRRDSILSTGSPKGLELSRGAEPLV